MRLAQLFALAGSLSGQPAGCGFEGGGAASDAPPIVDDAPPGDFDEDGHDDAIDNCPNIANTEQFDFDGDRRGDVCDGCPHVVDDAVDTDEDSIGNACDPRPDAKDMFRHFLAFRDPADIMAWRRSNASGTWTIADNGLHQDDVTSGLTLLDSPVDYGDIYFATRVEMKSLPTGASEVGFCGGDIATGLQYYCCAVGKNANLNARAASYWTGAGTQQTMGSAWAVSFDAGSTFEIEGLMSTSGLACELSQNGVAIPHSTSRGPAMPGAAVFYTSYAAAKYLYVFVVEIGS